MTNERVLTEAQIDLGVELQLWKDLRLAKIFFILISRGIPIADVIDIIAEYQGIKAPGRQWHEPSPENALPILACKGCNATFQPKYRQQVYHNKDCQQDAAYRRVLASKAQAQRVYADEVETKAAATAALVETVVDEAIKIFDAEAEAARVEPVVEEPTTEEPAKEESERGHGKLWALGRSITERNNQNKK